MATDTPIPRRLPRWLRQLALAGAAAGLTLLGAWLLLAWVDAGAPSPGDYLQRHPALGALWGVLSTVLAIALLAWQRRRKSR